MKKKYFSAFLAVLLASRSVFTLTASADDAADIAAQIQQADAANPDYQVSVQDLHIAAESVSMLEDGYGYIRRAATEADISDDYTGYVNGDVYSIINKDGETLFPYSLRPYSYADGIVSSVGGINCQYYYTQKGLTNEPCGYYTIDGTLLTGETYPYATPMSNGIAIVRSDGMHIINTSGEKLYTFPSSIIGIGQEDADFKASWDGIGISFENYSEGLIAFYAYAEYSGTFEKPLYEERSMYDSVEIVDYKTYWVHTAEHPYGYMDTAGNIVIPQQFDRAWPFHEGLALVKKDGLYGFINKSGDVVIPIQYENAYVSFRDGFAWVKQDGLWSGINSEGETVIPPEYTSVSYFSNDTARVMKDGKYGYINRQNETIIPFSYDSAYGGDGELFTVGMDGKYGIIDKNNQVVVPLIFDDISTVADGGAYAVVNQNVYYLDVSHETPQVTGLLGDVNGDGSVTVLDIITLHRYLLHTADLPAAENADLNADGVTDVYDLALLKRTVTRDIRDNWL